MDDDGAEENVPDHLRVQLGYQGERRNVIRGAADCLNYLGFELLLEGIMMNPKHGGVIIGGFGPN